MLSAVGAGDVGQAAGHTGVEGLLPYPPAPVPGAGCARGVDPGVATQAQHALTQPGFLFFAQMLSEE